MKRLVPVLLLALPLLAQEKPTFRILQINDVYKIEGLENGTLGGLARVRTLRKQLEADGTPLLVLHAGDALYPSVMSKFITPQGMISTLNLLDGKASTYDPYLLATFGNHEFDPDVAVPLLGSIAASDFRWVSSNTRYCGAPALCESFTARNENVRDTVMFDAGDTKIGVFGLTITTDKPWVRTSDPEAATRLALGRLKQDGAKVIVALTHQKVDEDVALLERHPEIDVVIGGHEHAFLERNVGGRPLTKADADAISAIVYDVTVPKSGPVRSAYRKVMLDSTVVPDPDVVAEVERWTKLLAKVLGPNDPVGDTEHLLEGTEPAVRGRETALGNLLADVMRDQMNTDVAMMQGGSIRINDNIPPGAIHKYDLEGIFFYSSTVLDVELTGQQLLDILRNSVSGVDVLQGKFMQVSNLKFKYRRGNPGEPSYTVDPAAVQIRRSGDTRWQPLDLTATYTAAIIDYLYNNGHKEGYTLFDPATRPKLRTPFDAKKNDLRAATERVLKNGKVTTGVEGRIVGPS